MTDAMRRIGSPSELAEVGAWRMTPSHARERVRLEAPGAPLEKVRAWEAQLTRHQSPCGCEQGALGLVIGVAGSLAYLLLRPGGWGDPGWREFWIGLTVVVVATSLGKLFGILFAKHKLRRITREIQSEWKPQRPPGREFGSAVMSEARAKPATRCCGGRWRF